MVDARAPAALAVAPLAVMLADARAPAALAAAPLAVMQADARAPAALADAPDADMIADARAPAFLAVACSGLWMWQCWQMPVPLALAPLAVMLLYMSHSGYGNAGRCPRSRTCPQSLFTQAPRHIKTQNDPMTFVDHVTKIDSTWGLLQIKPTTFENVTGKNP